MITKKVKGQSIIEILLAIGLSVIILPALFTAFMSAGSGKSQQNQRLQAVPLLMEAEEAIRTVRERDWESFAAYQLDIPYHPQIQNSTWILSSGQETINNFRRQLVIGAVYRNQNGDIVQSGGLLDPSTKKITVTVSWDSPLASSVNSVIYLTRHENLKYTETTDVDFNKGTKDKVAVTKTGDGEVILGSTGGRGDWCTPVPVITTLDLPKAGVANAIWAIQGQIATGTGENASGVSYANVLVTDPIFPANPVAAISGTFDGYKTNDVFTEPDYAYLGTDNNAKEVVIIDLKQKDVNEKYLEAGYFNAPGQVNGKSIFVAGNIGYMTDDNKLFNFDLSSKSGSRPVIDPDAVALPGQGIKMFVIGHYAYIATSSTSNQLVIVDLANANNLTIKDQISVNGGGSKGLFINKTATRAYLATAKSQNQREFFIIDIDMGSSTYKQTLSSYDTGDMDPKGVITVSGPRAIIIGIGGEEYQVIDITQEKIDPPNLLPRCGGTNIDSGVNGIATVFTTAQRAYSYIITGDQTAELKIIEGGPGTGGHDYSLSGTFESQTFDPSTHPDFMVTSPQVAFNRITANIVNPSSVTSIKLQVAAADKVAGSCNGVTFNFVGPDKTANSYFTSTDGIKITGPLPFDNDGVGYENPSLCFRYKAFLSTTDETLTPILNDVTLNFSP